MIDKMIVKAVRWMNTVIDHWEIDKERLSPALIRCETTSGRGEKDTERYKSLVNRKYTFFLLLLRFSHSLSDSHRSILQHLTFCAFVPFSTFRFSTKKNVLSSKFTFVRWNSSWIITKLSTKYRYRTWTNSTITTTSNPWRWDKSFFSDFSSFFNSNDEFRQNSSCWSSNFQCSNENFVKFHSGTVCYRSNTSCDRRKVRRDSRTSWLSKEERKKCGAERICTRLVLFSQSKITNRLANAQLNRSRR